MSTPSGTISFQSTLQVAIPAGSGVLSAYNVPVQPTETLSYAAGTGSLQIQKIAQTGGSAVATPASIDLSSLACVDGTTGFAHLRELVIFNDDATNIITIDFTATNAWVAPFSAGGTTAKIDIQPGTHHRYGKPKGTNGWVVDSTHKIVKLDPGSNTVAYRVMVAGD